MKHQHLFVFGLLLSALALAFGVMPTHAATITVVNTDDSGTGSLRQAIADAGSGDTIVFNLPYPATITLTSGEIVIGKNLTISGLGASNLTISGNNASRIFNINKGINVTISWITIANGAEYDGAGIYNRGTLTLVGSVISNNIAQNDGGGIYNHYDHGTLDVRESTFIGNSASWGGGIKNQSATATLTNCTFYNNSADYRGGGIDNGRQGGYPYSTVNITNCTFSGNPGGGIGNPASTTTATNSIVANSTGQACVFSFAAGSTNNLSTDSTCSPGFTQVTASQIALGTLTGSPAYFPLNTGSVAIDTGTNTGCPATDERGMPRPQDGGCDVGSYESALHNPVAALASISPNSAASGGATFTLTVNGTGLFDGSTVRWNGTDLVTTFLYPTNLTALVPAADIANAGVYSVTVFNPAPDGGTSNAQTFHVTVSLYLPLILR